MFVCQNEAVRGKPSANSTVVTPDDSKYIDGDEIPVSFNTFAKMNSASGKVKSNFGCFGGLISLLAWILEDFRFDKLQPCNKIIVTHF